MLTSMTAVLDRFAAHSLGIRDCSLFALEL
jgi:hypothetical protein